MPLGPLELLALFLILFLLFGATRLPKLARGVAQARRELRDSAADPTEVESS